MCGWVVAATSHGWAAEPEGLILQIPAVLPELGDNPSEPFTPSESFTPNILETAFEKPAEKKPAPTYPTVKINGFFQADAGWFGQDELNKESLAAINGIPNGDLQDGVDFRRARLSASGDVAENIGYFMEYDFGFPGRPSFMDHIVDIRNFVGDSTLRMGYWRTPFSMDALTSVKDLTFMERALPFTFLPFRQTGIGLLNGTEDGDTTWAVSGIRFPTDFYGGSVSDDGGYGVVGRVTAVPWAICDDQRLFHVGAGYTMADPGNDLIRYRAFPEFFVQEQNTPGNLTPAGVPGLTLPFADTGDIPTQNFQLFGGELAMIYHSLHMQSEVIYANVNQIAGPTANFWGAYARAGYFLTGEVRPYNRKAGVLGRITPLNPYGTCSGWGAWEVAGQWSAIDLNDGAIAGGRMNNLTAGLNWYLAKNFKLQLDHIHILLNSPGFGDSNADITALRAQVDF